MELVLLFVLFSSAVLPNHWGGWSSHQVRYFDAFWLSM